MFKINKLYAYLCATSALFAAPAMADELSETGEFLDGVAAVVGEGVVLKSDLRDQTALIIQRASEMDPPMQLPPPDVLREQMLERLIVTEVQMQRAMRIGLQVSDQMLNQAVEQVAINAGVPFEELPAMLAQDGVDYAMFRDDLREQVTLEQLRQIDVINRISITPREVRQCLEDLESNVAVDSDYNLSHILVSIPESASAREVSLIQAHIEDIHRQLVEGAEFSEMAIRYSKAQTALEGGVLGWMKGAELPTIYTDVVVALDAGGISDPFRSASSYHIVKVNDVRSSIQRSEINQSKVRHILITPNEIIDDETAKQRLEDAVERVADGEDFGEIAKLMSDDPGSANDGGDMGWSNPGTFVPEFEKVVDGSEIGVVSAPFRSRFGWHILEVLERRVYDNTEDLKESTCVNRIRNSKAEEETQIWIQRLRDQAFVDKRV